MEELVIRPATADDAPAMLDVARTLPQWFNDDGLAQMAVDFRQHAGAVAELGGCLVGLATWAPAIEPEATELTWLGVAPALRGRGIGRRLAEAAVAGARAAGSAALQVSTLADSVDYPPYAETRQFYRTIGFQDYRVDPDGYGPGADKLLLRHAL